MLLRLSRLVRVGVCALAAVVFSACSPVTGPSPSQIHVLTVVNRSSYDLELVSWTDDAGACHEFVSGTVYDSVFQKHVDGMPAGTSANSEVAPGTSPLVFYFAEGGSGYRTSEPLVVRAEDAAISFVLTDGTSVEVLE